MTDLVADSADASRRAWARAVALGDAETLAHYSDVDHARFRRDPHAVVALEQEMQRSIVVDGAPLALATILDMLKKEATSDRVKLDCANAILNRAGFIAPAASKKDAKTDLSLAEMSPGALQAFIVRMTKEVSSELAARSDSPGEILDIVPNGDDPLA